MSRKTYFLIKFIVFSVIIGGTIFLLFFNPFFKVEKWNFVGEPDINFKEASQLIQTKSQKKWFLFPQDNFFIVFLNRKSFETILKTHFPELKEVNVWPSSKNLFSSYNIFLEERNKIAIWCKNSCYYIDKTGYLFKQSPATTGPFITTIQDEADLNLQLGDKIQDTSLLQSILFLEEKFRQSEKLSIRKIEIFNENHDFAVITNQNWKLYFDPEIDTSNQYQVLNTLFERKKLQLSDAIDYIDLRIKNKAYVKRIE